MFDDIVMIAYPRSGFIHVDLGPARQWGERFPVQATAFAAETPPADSAGIATLAGGSIFAITAARRSFEYAMSTSSCPHPPKLPKFQRRRQLP